MIKGLTAGILQAGRKPQGDNSAVVAMSGGMDSAVAAMLLLEKGWTVRGLHLILPAPPGQAEIRAQRALALAEILGIGIDFLDLSESFSKTVIEPFFFSYLKGTTPNPCVICNAEIKFPALLETARKGLFSLIATGHYAVAERDQGLGATLLLRGEDKSREQSYFLHRVGSESLARVVFPLGGMTKDEVRKRASAAGLSRITGGESREVCFLGNDDYRSAINSTDPSQAEGDIVDPQGRVLGRHPGIHFYTIGQRHGLKISSPRPLYVKAVNHARKEVVVCGREGLFSRRVKTVDWVWTGTAPQTGPIRCTAQIRYRHQEAEGTLEILQGARAVFTFDRPQWAVTPGQALVCYLGRRVLGGGWIEEGCE